MLNPNQNDLVDYNLSNEDVKNLQKASNIATFLGIGHFVFSSITIIFGVISFIFLSAVMSFAGSFDLRLGENIIIAQRYWGVAIFWIALPIGFIIIAYWLFNFASKLSTAIRKKNQEGFESAIESLRRYLNLYLFVMVLITIFIFITIAKGQSEIY